MVKDRRRSESLSGSKGRLRVPAFVIKFGIIGFTLVVLVAVLLKDGDGTSTPIPPTELSTGVTATSFASSLSVASAEEAAEAFLAAWSLSDWSTVSAYAGTDDAGQYLAIWWQGLSARSVDLSLRELLVEDARTVAYFDASITLFGGAIWEYVGWFELVETGKDWAVLWSEAVAHPDLGLGETLTARSQWPSRGLITARDGTPLVGPFPKILVGIIPERVKSSADVAAAFATHTSVDKSKVESLLARADLVSDWFYPVTTIPRTSYAELKPALYPVAGVAFRLEERRAPLGQPVADYVIGRTGEITAEILSQLGDPYQAGLLVGRSGLERSFESMLAGRPSIEIVKWSAVGQEIELLDTVDGRDSYTLVTSLSVDIQRAIDSVLEETELPIAIAVVDIQTGGILGIASRPLLDFDRALGGLYPPGSTFKIIVAAALLESGIAPGDIVSCPGRTTIQGREFTNSVELPRSMTLLSAFAVSCNTAFIELAQELGPGVLEDMARRFGFEAAYDAGLPTAGAHYPTPLSEVEAVASTIGQGKVLVSPLHMAAVAAGVATGSWTIPTFTGDGASSDLIAEGHANDLRMMMEAVVTDGTAKAAQVEGRVVAGKTGTAEINNETVGNIAWFVGYSGDLALAVMVEGGSSGGSAAAPLAAQILQHVDTMSPVSAECVDVSLGWFEYQGSGTRSGCAMAPLIESPRVEWRAEIGIQAWLNSPLVVGELIIVSTAGSSRMTPDGNDGVVALNLHNGHEQWRFGASNDVNGLASDGRIVIAAGDEGAVWALDVVTGGKVWQVAFPSPVFSSPLIIGDSVIVGDAAGVLRALSLVDGSVLWSTSLNGPIRGGAATDGSLVYAAGELGDLRAFTIDGFEIWRTQVATSRGDALVRAAPTIIGDMVVVSAIREGDLGGPGIVAYDKYVGTVRWIATDPDGVAGGWAGVQNSAAVAGSHILFGSSLAYGFQSVGQLTGYAEWASPSAVKCQHQISSPVVVGNVAYLARLDGTLSAIDIARGAVLWSLPLTIAGERAVVHECEVAGLFAPGASLEATPAIAPDGTILVGSVGGILYAVGEG